MALTFSPSFAKAYANAQTVQATFGDFVVTSASGDESKVSFANDTLTLSGGTHTISMASSSPTMQTISVTGASTITLQGVQIDRSSVTDGTAKAPLAIADNATFDVTVLLADDSENILYGELGGEDAQQNPLVGSSGIQKNGATSGKLTIDCPEGKQNGVLRASGGQYATAIGSCKNNDLSNLIINNGIITCGQNNPDYLTFGSCIGSACFFDSAAYELLSGNTKGIYINGGTITLNPDSRTKTAVALGCANEGNCEDIFITGGNLVINGGQVGIGSWRGSVNGVHVSGGSTSIASQNGISGSGYDVPSSKISNITISGGSLEITADNGPAIGSKMVPSSNTSTKVEGITISGGNVVAHTKVDFSSAEAYSAAIGTAGGGSVSGISITGGTVEAISNMSCAIGASGSGLSNNISITGGVVKASAINGPKNNTASAIGSDDAPSGCNSNKIGGNAVVIASSVADGRQALDGFAPEDLTQGVLFSKAGETAKWQSVMYGNDCTVTEDVTFPADFTISKTDSGSPKKLSVADGVTLTLPQQVSIKNDGELAVLGKGKIECEAGSETISGGQVLTQVVFDAQGGTFPSNETKTQYVPYLNNTGVLKYTNLPEPTKEGETLEGWYTEASGKGTKCTSSVDVLPNTHALYANWSENPDPTPDPGPDPTPTPDPDPEPGPTPDPEPTPSDTGWEEDDQGWKYILPDGSEAEGWQWIEQADGGYWYYFGEGNYAITTGWTWVVDHWYYFYENGEMATSTWLWDGAWYWVCSTGPMIQGLWQWIDGAWYGFWWNGAMCQGWVWDNAYVAWFYCFDNGVVARNMWFDGYYFLDSGICLI